MQTKKIHRIFINDKKNFKSIKKLKNCIKYLQMIKKYL